ncbi:MAG: BlaI/MecI/CopY family transcriptional regulator [Planctomycetes bacterium]|nr:BlaI/MecI/CopY family transcriptional regulator [Planctomycetota bacterium]
MARRPTNGPTEGELEILGVLWERGPSSAREVHEALSRERPTAATTTLKLMQIMVDKGLLDRDESQRPQVYRAAVTKERTERKLIGNLLARAFDGSAAQLVMRALSAHDATPEELDRIRRLLDQMEESKS